MVSQLLYIGQTCPDIMIDKKGLMILVISPYIKFILKGFLNV